MKHIFKRELAAFLAAAAVFGGILAGAIAFSLTAAAHESRSEILIYSDGFYVLFSFYQSEEWRVPWEWRNGFAVCRPLCNLHSPLFLNNAFAVTGSV